MNTLFPVDPVFPEGLTYSEGFLTVQEEKDLVETLAGIDVQPFIFQGYKANRKTASFGFDYNFTNKKLTKSRGFPAEMDWLVQQVAAHLKLDKQGFAELLVTEYPPGSVINWHRDAPPFDIIAGISLLSDCIFKFRLQDKTKQTRGNVISLPVKRRSLYVMQGPSRSEWQHSIAPVQHTRYSITLRTLKS